MRYGYAPWRRQMDRDLLSSAKPLDAADASRFPPGVHRVTVEDRRGPTLLVKGTGARRAWVPGTAPIGATVTLKVTEEGSVRYLLSHGLLLLVRDGEVLWKGDGGPVSGQVSAADLYLIEQGLDPVRSTYELY